MTRNWKIICLTVLVFGGSPGYCWIRQCLTLQPFGGFAKRWPMTALSRKLFEEITEQLDAKELLRRQGTVVDATIIDSVNRPLSDKKREKLSADPSPQIDTDANSTKKGGTCYFGYKGHIGVDAGSKLIRKISFTPAAPLDSTVLEDLVCEDERSLFGDKAYDRDSLKQIARDKGWYYCMLDKGKRGDPLSSTQKKRNKRHQQVRSQVEHPFTSIKRSLRPAMGPGQNKSKKQSPLYNGVHVLEH